ncbi:hypothetical protein, partial [Undibacterium sp. GrIS 1.2]|uniref:hypothetical protein n=1 Tax=Undibacterium sp. GrIS 1.2 TaxID=3143933 RepID=UPI00339134E5
MQAAIASGDNFHGYIPSESLEFIVRNYRRLAFMKALEAAWLDAYVHASNFKECKRPTQPSSNDEMNAPHSFVSKLRRRHEPRPN